MNTIHPNSLWKSTWTCTPLPDDLSQIFPAGELVQYTLEAVNTFFWAGATGETSFFARAFNPRVMLTVLTFSYATGRFCSADIARGCQADETLRYLCLGVQLAPERIRVFRGQNLELLRRCLAQVLRRANASWTPDTATELEKQEPDNLDVEREAKRRIALALGQE